ncbi:transporter substrate-binding domain-containing protein [Pseudoxanthomonas kalamensis]|uniref:transporter substrate-binding domain-containing protein n=1 Tax=Pseudoxanthomonas kalamensis TaxID=289483 RepID=UPI001391109B|nr:transporter substrate-binding domain-containing protein [Pseudoxanthomonas kalamensis]
MPASASPWLRLALALPILLMAAVAGAQTMAPSGTDTPPARKLTVGVKVAPPFVTEQGDGIYSGLAIDLWDEIAQERGWETTFKRYELDDLLEAVEHGDVDAGLGAITATAEREKLMDFSHPITSSGLGIAVRSQRGAGWLAVARAFFSPGFLKVLAALATLLLVIGALTWLAERRRNPEHFGGPPSQGIASGFWWAAVTMTTVGYGDKAPVTLAGRLVGLLWMFAALIIVSTFTAAITSALTVGQLSSRITQASDLDGLRIASLAGTTSAEWLQGRGLDFDDAADIDAALASLANDECDAVVYDAPLLQWTIGKRYRGRLEMLPLRLERQDYAFALPAASALREPLNESLLERINAPGWRARVEGYLGGKSE